MSSPLWTLGLAERHCEKKNDLHAICKCPVGKQNPPKACDIKIGLNKGSTTSIRYHIRIKHPLQWDLLRKAETEKEKNKADEEEEIQRIYADVEQEVQLDESVGQVPRSSGSQKRPLDFQALKSSKAKPRIPVVFQKQVKYNIRDKKQLKFDLGLMKMMAMTNQSFEFANSIYVIEFFEEYLPQFHIKSSRTMSRNKLPQVFLNVKKAVDAKLALDLPQCEGIGFTCDFWTSK